MIYQMPKEKRQMLNIILLIYDYRSWLEKKKEQSADTTPKDDEKVKEEAKEE